jgi:hypothetical protein
MPRRKEKIIHEKGLVSLLRELHDQLEAAWRASERRDAHRISRVACPISD